MQLKVRCSREYNVTVSEGMDEFENCLPIFGKKVAVITDENVNALYPHFLDPYFKGKEVHTYVVKAGEDSKSGETYLSLLNSLAKDGFGRGDAVVTFGGGVVGDLGGFVASTYARGIALIAVPTTLLADVDSSVGGKTAINLDEGKNLCGTFYQPYAVYINVEFLKTLPEREVRCGKGEIAKYSLLLGEKIDLDDIKNCIYTCLKYKKGIVEEDEKEGGKRKLLNLGHTFGHAVEKHENYALSHGECVGIGLRYILKLSKAKGLVSTEKATECEQLLDYYGCPEIGAFDYGELEPYVKIDKKSVSDGVDLVLLDGDLSPVVERISFDELRGYDL